MPIAQHDADRGELATRVRRLRETEREQRDLYETPTRPSARIRARAPAGGLHRRSPGWLVRGACGDRTGDELDRGCLDRSRGGAHPRDHGCVCADRR